MFEWNRNCLSPDALGDCNDHESLDAQIFNSHEKHEEPRKENDGEFLCVFVFFVAILRRIFLEIGWLGLATSAGSQNHDLAWVGSCVGDSPKLYASSATCVIPSLRRFANLRDGWRWDKAAETLREFRYTRGVCQNQCSPGNVLFFCSGSRQDVAKIIGKRGGKVLLDFPG